MPGIQLPIGIDMVNPVPADFKYGPYANTAAAIAAIPQVLRYDGLTVQITGTGEYHWLAADLTDPGLVPKTSGGSELPIARYIYLVQDASDAVRMGGATSNVYTTAQAAYNAAVVLRAALGGTERVEIVVGNITSAVAGDIILTANWDQYITISGSNTMVSEIGNIIGSNASGNGFTVGAAIGISVIKMAHIKIGNIITTATGPTGSSGTIGLALDNTIIGNLDTSITDITNPGNAGRIRVSSTIAGKLAFDLGNITATAPITEGANITVTSNADTFSTGDIITGGQIAVSGISGVVGNLTLNSTQNISMFLTNVSTNGSINFTTNSGQFQASRCQLSGVVITATTGVPTIAAMQDTRITTLTCSTNFDVTVRATNCTLGSIQDLGNNSIITGCTLDSLLSSGLNPINRFGTNCVIYNSTLIGSIGGGIKAINHIAGSYSIVASDTTLIGGVSSSTLVINDSLTPVINSDGFGNFTIDASIHSTVFIYLTGENGGSNTLTFSPIIFNKTLRVIVDNSTTGADTLSLSTYFVSGGSYTPSIGGWPDLLTILFDDQGNGFITPTYDYQQIP